MTFVYCHHPISGHLPHHLSLYIFFSSCYHGTISQPTHHDPILQFISILPDPPRCFRTAYHRSSPPGDSFFRPSPNCYQQPLNSSFLNDLQQFDLQNNKLCCQATPSSVSGRTDSVVMDDDDDEWVAQVEPGVLVTFASLPNGGNDLKRIRFSRDVFNKWQAQRWWAENYDKVMELYNVQRFNRQAVALPTPPRSEDESSKIESDESSPETPPLCTERKPRNLHHPNGKGSSSDSLDQHPMQSHKYNDSALASTPKFFYLKYFYL